MSMSLDWINAELEKLKEENLLRTRVSRSGKLSPKVVIDGQRYISFGSNDYLGIAGDAALNDVVAKSVFRSGWGSGASPLIIGRSAMHAELERRLATFVGHEAALLFPTGFAANVGTIPALVGKQDAVFSDAKNHASIIDGCRLSGARIHIYPHGQADALKELLKSNVSAQKKLIVTDSIFSMDGDAAPLCDLVRLAKEHGCMLLIDEAHGLGVLGPKGRGLAAELDLTESIDVLVGTLSKSFGSHGGFVTGSRSLIDYLSNRARSYVFSTAAPIANTAVALSAMNIMRDEPQRRERVVRLSQYFREQAAARSWNTGSSAHHIIPLILGDTQKAIELSAFLRKRGFWVPCIRPPTVPPGESCLRISISSAHSDPMIENLLVALDEYFSRYE